MLNKLFLIYTIMMVIKVKNSIQNNVISYNDMPPLHNFDDYHQCLNLSSSSSMYCTVFGRIQADNTSPLWLYIEEYSNNSQHHYRHDHLQFGVCVERCERLLVSVKYRRNESNSGQHKQTDNNEIVSYYEQAFESGKLYGIKYQQLINNCLNYEFQFKYNLTLDTYIEYCVNSNNIKSPWIKDNIDLFACIIFGLIILLNVLSSLYDYYLKRKWEQTCNPIPTTTTIPTTNQMKLKLNFYELELNNPRQRFLASFSIWRNYSCLFRRPQSSEFEFLNGVRTICLSLVIMAHVTMLFMVPIMENSQFIEDAIKYSLTMLLKNGTVILQTFFFLSGFLLYHKFRRIGCIITTTSTISLCFNVFFRIFIERYMKFSITLLILILFHATYVIKLGEGPFWHYLTFGEVTMCRKYWWKNIFMINNFSFQESCSHHTWYLAADMQLYALYTFLLILIARFPKIKHFTYTAVGILSFLIPFVITWILKLDGVYHIKPESYRYLFFNDITLLKSYTPFYTNLGGYFWGIVFADFYFNTIQNDQKKKETNIDPNSKNNSIHKKFLCYMIYPAWLLLLFSGLLISKNILNKPFGTAIYDALYRNLWSLVTFYAFYGLFYKFNDKLYKLLSLDIWRPLARLSYEAYLWHLLILRFLIGSINQPLKLTYSFMMYNAACAFIFTSIIAFFSVILFEYPLDCIMRLILNSYKTKSLQQHKD